MPTCKALRHLSPPSNANSAGIDGVARHLWTLSNCHPTDVGPRRCVLADADDVICHRTGESPSWKDPTWVQFAFNGDRNQSCHQSYFLIPPLWMLEQCDGNSRLEGKLQCPKCSSKLGAFDWKKSLPCPCGATFRPAFYFTASRVDPLKN